MTSSSEMKPSQSRGVQMSIASLRGAEIGGTDGKSGHRRPAFEAWSGGPLRRSPIGTPGKYDCAACKKPVTGVYRTAKGWVCADCRKRRQ